MLKLVDRQGQLLGLRSDFTGSIARIAGTRLRDLPGPLRLCYSGTVIREGNGHRELYQAGCELYGVAGAAGDAEVVAVAMDALAATGIAPRVAIGSVAVLEALLPNTPGVRRALDRRDRRTLLSLPEMLELPVERRAAAEALLELVGGREVLIDARRLLPDCGAALDELEETAARLEGHDVELDLAHVRTPAYYTGVVFDLYAEGAPRPLGGGGRYDGLARRFGPDRPGVGFSIDLDGLAHLAIRNGLC